MSEIRRFDGSSGLSGLRNLWLACPRTCTTRPACTPLCSIRRLAALAMIYGKLPMAVVRVSGEGPGIRGSLPGELVRQLAQFCPPERPASPRPPGLGIALPLSKFLKFRGSLQHAQRPEMLH